MSERDVAATQDMGACIDALWNDEGCSWSARYDGGKWWTVVLEWTTDRLYVHDADWATLTWEFYDESLDVALLDTVKWVEQLAVWRRCPECDGRGEWNGNRCDECNGSGLDSGSTGDPA